MALVVTPDVLRSTQQAIESALEHATAIANNYLSTHEGIGSAWQGGAQGASLNSATQINHDLQQIITGGTRLAHGLNQAAALMEAHEEESAHTLTSFAAAG